MNIQRGSLRELLGKVQNLKRYLLCIPLLGSNFFVTGVLLTLSPEIGRATGAHEVIKANIALGIYFFAAALGDWLGARLSNRFQSRKLVARVFILGNVFSVSILAEFNFECVRLLRPLCHLWLIQYVGDLRHNCRGTVSH